MAKGEDNSISDSHWLNWCRLCGSKEDIQGNVKIYTNQTENTENSVVEMAIRKFFDVHMQEKDEPYGVVCETCYTFMIKLIDFAEHVTKVQAIFKLLRNTAEKPEIYESPNTKDLLKITPEKENINLLYAEEVSNPSCTAFDQTANKEISLSIESKNEIIKSEDETQIETTQYSISEAFNFSSIDEDITNISRTVESEKHSNGNDSYYCKLCNRTLASEKNLRTHMECIHERSFECHVCGKQFMSKMKLSKHKAVHINERPFICMICKASFKSGAGLNRHHQIHKAPKHKCDECGKQFTEKTKLSKHKLVHSEERPFSCSTCNVSFKTNGCLIRHSQIHEKPSYVCKICGKKVKTRGSLLIHQDVHSNARKHKCTICSYATKRSTTLRHHLLTHTNLRPPYNCKYCNEDFASLSTIRYHKERMHPEEYARDEDKSSPCSKIPALHELRELAIKNHRNSLKTEAIE